jgi:endonuclease/exonuclease/phosphatase family metal-dependent hydrolase
LKENKSSMFLRLMFYLNVIAILSLLFSYLASYISPAGGLWWLQFFGLAFGAFFILNLFFIIFWLIFGRRKAYLSLIAILIGINKLFAVVQPNFNAVFSKASDKKNDGASIKVMTFNVRVFDLYNWFHKQELKDKILQFLKQESPDIVCFQEYYSSESKVYNFNMNDTLTSIIPASYSHIEYTLTLHNNKDHWGIATFSKYPIVERKAIPFQKNGKNVFLCTDILMGEDTFRVVNSHLESIRFKEEDYKFVENIGGENEEEISGSMNILRKMKRAYVKRALQVNVLKSEISKSPYPVILCGDFNDTPNSYTYSILTDRLTDAFRESGSGLGRTYTGAFPSFRIDYILHDKRLRSTNYTTYLENLSDHYPISCIIHLEKKINQEGK